MFVFVDVVVVVQSSMHNSATKSVNPTKPIVFKKAEDVPFFLLQTKVAFFVGFCCKKRLRFCC